MGSRGKRAFSNNKSKIKKTLYHGSGYDFTSFEEGHSGKTTGNKGAFGQGFYLTSKKEYADYYVRDASNNLGEGNIYSVKVNIEKPFYWNSIKTEEQFDEFAATLNVPGLTWNRYEKGIHQIMDDETSVAFTKALKKLGYDGVVFKFKGSDQDEIVAFDPDQIKIIGKERGSRG